jgi:hypothetical protein
LAMPPQPQPHAVGPQPSVPALPRAAHCSGDRGCPFPPMADGLCRIHLRDRDAEASPVGGCHSLLQGFAPVEEKTVFREKKSFRRCRPLETEREHAEKAHAAYLARQSRKLSRGGTPIRNSTCVGSKHGRATLTETDVLEIRAQAGTQSQKSLAQKYRVSEATVCNILARRNWNHI